MESASDWDGLGTDDSLHYVRVASHQLMPDKAAETLVDRVRNKYGPAVDLTRWRFTLRESGGPRAGRVLHYRVDDTGRLFQLFA
jgi:hypothetical protein